MPLPRTTPIAAVSSIAALRYASTHPPPAPVNTSPPVTDTTSSFSNIDTITIDDLAKSAIVDPNAIPEQIGYLHAVGIDYGYGPTSMIQWLLEHTHIWFNVPWWGSIVLTAAALRLLLFPLYLKMSDGMARQAALAPVLKPFVTKMTEAQRAGNTAGALEAYRQQAAIKKRAGITSLALFTPMIAQGILGFCGFRLMRHMATLPVPGLLNGGFLWLQDLTLTDGYLLLPLMMAATMHMVFRLGGESGAAGQMPPGMQKFMMWGMPVMVMLFTSWQPGAVALWFVGSGVIGIPQAMLLQKPAVRKWLGLAPIYKPKPGEAGANPFQAFLDARNGTTTTAAARAYPDAGGKNAAVYMKYQSPNIRTAVPPRTIVVDTKLVDKASDDMVQASAPPAKSIFEQARDKFDQVKTSATRMSETTPEQKRVSEKAEFKRRADAYEKRAKAAARR